MVVGRIAQVESGYATDCRWRCVPRSLHRWLHFWRLPRSTRKVVGLSCELTHADLSYVRAWAAEQEWGR